MEKIIRCANVSLPLLLVPLSAATEWQVGRGAVTADVAGSLTYDSNVEGNASGQDDVFASLTPTARYRRIDSLLTTEASLSATAQRYFENDEFDNESYRANYSLRLPRDEDLRTFGLGFQAGYNESVDIDPDLSERISSKTYTTSVDGEMMFARVHLVNANAGYEHSERDIGSTRETYRFGSAYSYNFNDGTAVGASYRHRVSRTQSEDPTRPSLDQTSNEVAANVSRPLYAGVRGFASLGYRWLDRGGQENDSGLSDSDGYTFGMGLEGQFLPKKYFPKTTGTFRIAYEDSATPGLNDDSSARLVGSINIDWQARQTTTVGLTLARSQDLTASDDTVVNNSISARATQQIGYFLTAIATVGYTQAEYAGSSITGSSRSDDRYNASLSFLYQINANWSSALSYTYQKSISSRANSDFDRHTLSLSATYAF